MSSDSETKLTPINTDCSVDNLSSAYFGTENEKLYLFASKSEVFKVKTDLETKVGF